MMEILGYSVWEEYTIQIEIIWTNFKGEENMSIHSHSSDNITENSTTIVKK